MIDEFYKQPVLNSPYEIPKRHWELDEKGNVPTDNILPGRRPCSLITPIPRAKKQKAEDKQENLIKEKYDPYPIINEIRNGMAPWRAISNSKDWQVSPETERLLLHWRQKREGFRPFFCQIEAVETIIWLTEVMPKSSAKGKKFWEHLANANHEANPELFRIALKLATGAGKTLVMAMLIAWQVINAVRRPQSKSFTRAFLIVTPGITIKDRLRVLMPNDPDNYYEHRHVIPKDMLGDIQKVQIVITNYHSFMLHETLQISKGTKALLQGASAEIKTKESEGQMMRRVMSNLMGTKNIIAINDEAHHCYREKAQIENESSGGMEDEEKEEVKKNNEAARLWISGLEAVNRKLGLRVVYDLSATPFFLAGSGYQEGTLFPWSMSDFSLMDAIECGIVKLPRVPIVSNDLQQMPKYRSLWEHIGSEMPKKGRRKSKAMELDPLRLPETFNMALDALYKHYEETFNLWKAAPNVKVPPVFIIVCNNTASSKLIYDYISGFFRESEKALKTFQSGALKLFHNYDRNGKRHASPKTLLIDSEQLNSGDALDQEFRKMAAEQIETFRRELRERGELSKAENLKDEDLLREVVNTIGKEGRLGANIRCVVSVAMLSEGWDANTVTHILGVRAFGTQLLCEQVVGRALRRFDYEVEEDGLLRAEYADIFGIPFDFTAKPTKSFPKSPIEKFHIHAVKGRAKLAIEFPQVQGYRVALPNAKITAKFNEDHRLKLTPDYAEAYEVTNSGIIGERVDLSPDTLRDKRVAEVSFCIARHLLYHSYRDPGENPKSHLFPQFQNIVREYIENYVSCKGSTHIGLLCYHKLANDVCERIKRAIAEGTDDKDKIEAVMDPYNPKGSTAYTNFYTKKGVYTPDSNKCHLKLLSYDSEWEAEFCRVAEKHPKVFSFVKNQGLGFKVPYKTGWSTRDYYPDFILKVDDGKKGLLHLVVEIKGYRGENAKEKADTMRSYWLRGVNALGKYGRWDFVEFKEDVYDIQADFNKYMEKLCSKETEAGKGKAA